MVKDVILESQPWAHGGRFNDVDAQAAQLHGYGQQYLQLSRGPFEGRFRSFDFGDDLGIHFESANRVLAQSASTPRGRFAACVLTEASTPCAMNAGEFSDQHVALCPEFQTLEGTTGEGVSLCCIDISAALLPEGGQDMRAVRVQSDARRARRLWELVQAGVSAFTALDCPAGYPAAVRQFKSTLADLLWQTATRSRDQDPGTANPHATARALHVFRRAREYIHEGLEDGISIVALCRDIGVSRRSLEYVFQSVIGMGPGNYARTLQLNHVRRDLMSPASGDLPIGVIAARRGIWHWSRFSQHYRLLYGELPSQTRLRRGRSRAAGHAPQASYRRRKE
jgi:AraC family ethanolamine operon transcriptional activator